MRDKISDNAVSEPVVSLEDFQVESSKKKEYETHGDRIVGKPRSFQN